MRRGRPRQFDVDEVLDCVMRVFWASGFSGTSVKDLEAATGLCRPSLYGAFGDKRGLFLRSLERYKNVFVGALVGRLQAAPTARSGVEELLRASIAGQCSEEFPGGCLVTNTLGEDVGPEVEAVLQEMAQEVRAAVEVRILGGIEAGELPAETDASGLALQVAVTQMGMATWTRAGGDPHQLLGLVDSTLAAWPQV